jgi:hypothetical protein
MKKNLLKGLFAKDNKEDQLTATLNAIKNDLNLVDIELAKITENSTKEEMAAIKASALQNLRCVISKFNKPVVLALLGASEKEDGTIKFNKKPVSAETLTDIINVSSILCTYARKLGDTKTSAEFDINAKKVKAAKADTRNAIAMINDCVMTPNLICELNAIGVQLHKNIFKKRCIIIGSVAIVITAAATAGYFIYNKKHQSSDDDLDIVDSVEIDEDTYVDADMVDTADAEIAGDLVSVAL